MRDGVGGLQRTLGNQAIQALVKNGTIHPELYVSSPMDPAEREAERVAARMPSSRDATTEDRTHRTESLISPCTEDVELVDESVEHVPRSSEGGRGGQPLPDEMRAFFEPRIGMSFDGVRVHTGDDAARMSRDLGARAFTHGWDIYFGAGEYAPNSAKGSHLLAHELTHVVQQSPSNALGARFTRGVVGSVVQRTALSSLSPRQRLALQIRTQQPILPPEKIDEFFEKLSNGRWGMSRPSPGGANVRLGPDVPPALQTPLTTVAAYLHEDVTITQSGQSVRLLAPNSVVRVPMDLTGHGGAEGLYRYTWYGASRNRRGGTLLIESLSAIGGPPAGPLQEAEHTPGSGQAAGTITAGGETFHLVGSSWTPSRIGSLRAALSLMPQEVIRRASGLKFEIRAGGLGTGRGSQDEGGHYDPERDTVVLFPVAWGQGGRSGQQIRTSDPVQVIAHEIAHAIDRRILNEAEERYEQSARTRSDLKKLLRVRGLSGGRFTVEEGARGLSDELSDYRSNAFRKAYLRDGASVKGKSIKGAVTLYGAQKWEEVFAEAFSLYIIDPQALSQVRPHVFQYFAKRFPRQRSTAFVRLAQDRTLAQIVQIPGLAQQSIDVPALKRLNPEIQSSTTVSAGTVIWLKAREVSAQATEFEAIANRYFGDRLKWPTVWSFNPQIQHPMSIDEETRIHLQSKKDRDQFGEITLY